MDQSKCVIILVYNGLNYYAATLPPILRELYYKKSHQEPQLNDVIMKYQEIQQLLLTSNARANMDRALLHLCAADNLIKAAELTSGAGDIMVSKEVAVLHVHKQEHAKGHDKIILNCLPLHQKKKVEMVMGTMIHKIVEIKRK